MMLQLYFCPNANIDWGFIVLRHQILLESTYIQMDRPTILIKKIIE